MLFVLLQAAEFREGPDSEDHHTGNVVDLLHPHQFVAAVLAVSTVVPHDEDFSLGDFQIMDFSGSIVLVCVILILLFAVDEHISVPDADGISGDADHPFYV